MNGPSSASSRRVWLLAVMAICLGFLVSYLAAAGSQARKPGVVPGLVFRFEAHDASGKREVVCDFCVHRFAGGDTYLETRWIRSGWPLSRWLGRVAIAFRRTSVQPLPPLRAGDDRSSCAAARERSVDYDTVVVMATEDRVRLEGTGVWIRIQSIGADDARVR